MMFEYNDLDYRQKNIFFLFRSVNFHDIIKIKKKYQVLPRFELGSLDSKSKVLTATP